MKNQECKNNPDTLADKVRKIILVMAIGVFLFSVYQLYCIYSEYQKAVGEYDELSDAVIFDEPTQELEGEGSGELGYKQIVDFDQLKKTNEDVVGWIQFESLPISYPVMQGKDNDYYLNHTFQRTQNSSASIFLDYQSSSEFEDLNTFVYGHNMKNRSMFGRLNSYGSKEFYDENQYFWIYTPIANYRYHIFSCYIVRADGNSYQMFYPTQEDYQEYLSMIQGYGSYDTGVEVTTGDSIVSLSTCTSNPENRFLVHGVRIESYEAE